MEKKISCKRESLRSYLKACLIYLSRVIAKQFSRNLEAKSILLSQLV